MKPLETRPSWRSWIARFARSDDGPTGVEYAVMIAIIVIVCFSAIKKIGTDTNKVFKDVKKAVKSGS